MAYTPPVRLNLADHFLDARVREGKGDRTAILTEQGALTYAEVQRLANRFGNLLAEAGVQPEQRVILALPDIPEFAAALFGVVKVGGVVVMVNPHLKPDEVSYFYEYTRAPVALIHRDTKDAFLEAAQGALHLEKILIVGESEMDLALEASSDELATFPSHRDDAAIWLFSGGTTGRPKAVVQPHRSFVNTTELYAKGVLGYCEDDIVLSVPKLYFGYATGSNLLFPFSVGATSVLFPERCVTDVLFDKIARFRPTILINVPTMVNHMVNHAAAADADLSCVRIATSAGEALPAELHDRWNTAFGVELLDGLGTAEMWHVFLSNRPGDVRPGMLGIVVPGFEVRVTDEDGTEVPHGEVGTLRVRGDSRGLGYWQQVEQDRQAFQGEWYVSNDMVSRTEEGVFTYCGRSDDMIKVSGQWLSPKEVENCLLRHPAVIEAAVVGIEGETGLVKPHAFVIAEPADGLEAALQAFVKEHLSPFKYPRRVHVRDSLPRTHLGKVDRGALRASVRD